MFGVALVPNSHAGKQSPAQLRCVRSPEESTPEKPPPQNVFPFGNLANLEIWSCLPPISPSFPSCTWERNCPRNSVAPVRPRNRLPRSRPQNVFPFGNLANLEIWSCLPPNSTHSVNSLKIFPLSPSPFGDFKPFKPPMVTAFSRIEVKCGSHQTSPPPLPNPPIPLILSNPAFLPVPHVPPV